MPPKRKRDAVDVEQGSPRKRRTRSTGALQENEPQSNNSSPVKRRKTIKGHVDTPCALAESKVKTPDDDDDELLLSPLKARAQPHAGTSRTGTPRYFMESVEIVTSPVKRASPSKKAQSPRTTSPTRTYSTLPQHLHACLHAQKCAILRVLQKPPDPYTSEENIDDREPETNEIALKQLGELLKGTVDRGEGNSCLLLGPRGSGKSRLVEHCIMALEDPPIVLRLSGWVHTTDRLALREIAHQLSQQTGSSLLSKAEQEDTDADEAHNPFISSDTAISLPPSSHLPQLISAIPTLSRATIVILDGFDLFALHPRQSLLYCLLDTVQSCRSSHGNKGIAVVGVTSRVDTINLLEKRVKSRFSGRILRTAPPRHFESWMRVARNALCTPIEDDSSEWSDIWNVAIDDFLTDSKVCNILNETFALTKDVRMLSRILVMPILELEPSSPYPSSSSLSSTVVVQRCRPRFPYLHAETYPSICLLIAAMHSITAGQDVITFEMLFECFRDQVRSSTSAPVQVEGGGIGMVRCSREVLMTAFERLQSTRAFVSVAAPSPNVAKEFVRYRCVVGRDDVKKAVEKMGQTNLKKWLTKAQ